jgi:single-stranded-DNA-specific exonuclease
MEIAVERIFEAISKKQKIVIYGDYDVDGATSSAILKKYLRSVGIDSEVYIPDRISEGYGLNSEALLSLRKAGTDLVITVDCGVVSFEPIALAKEAGLDVIVIDHHLGMEELPEAVALVNPNRFDETSELGHLCAAGVAYLLVIALNRKLRAAGFFNSLDEPDLFSFLDLVALGTVCDVMLLKGLNRAFVHQGLKIMSRRENIGIRSICDVAGLDRMPDVYSLGFVIGPRINAAGRISDCSLGSKLLSCEDEQEAHEMAVLLNALNAERQEIEKRTLDEAISKAEQMSKEMPFLLIAGDKWHPGVIGIVAGRIKEAFDKPTAIVALADGIGKASARSVGGVDIGRAISNAKSEGLLISGGGHRAAAGFTVEEDKISQLNNYICEKISDSYREYANDNSLKAEIVIQPQSVTVDLVKDIAQLAPFGNGNPEPKFIIENAKIVNVKEYGEKHLAVFVSPAGLGKASSKAIKCMFFNKAKTEFGERIKAAMMKEICILGKIKINSWQGVESAEIIGDDAVIY